MKKSQAEPTTAKNLERKFNRGEEVLDYFDVRKARVIGPRSASPGAKTNASSAHSVKRESRSGVVREKSAAYRKDARRKAKRAQ